MLSHEDLGFDINNTGRDLVLLLRKELRDYGITSEQWTVLKNLKEKDRINIKELVRKVRKDQANVTRILDLLAQRDYVSRIPNPKDKRSSLILLTDKGMKITKELLPIDKKAQRIALEGVESEELEVFRSVLAKISNNLSKELDK